MPHRKLHILIFAYWHDKGWKGFVGATVKIWDLAHNTARLGHNVFLFLPKYELPADSLPFRLIRIPLFDFPLLRSLSFSFLLALFLLCHCSNAKPDVVYIRRGISLIPAIFATLKKSILIYEVNDDPYAQEDLPSMSIFSRVDRWLSIKTDEIALCWCNAAFVITKQIGDKIIRQLPRISPTKIHVVPSGTNTNLYRPMDKHQCRSMLHLEPTRTYIGFMGSLLDHQGVEVLIDAAPHVINSFPDTCFVIIGEGPMKDRWRRRVHEQSIQRNFLFTGQIDYEKTPVWINAMDICTAPYIRAAGLRSPVKIFDYLACGRPVIASRIPGTTDIFEDSGAVRLVEPENKEAFAAAIVDLLSNTETASSMGLDGRRWVEAQYDRMLVAKRLEETVHALRKDKGDVLAHAPH